MNRNVLIPKPLELLSRSQVEGVAKHVLSRLTASRAVVLILNNASASAHFSRNDLQSVDGDFALQVRLEVDFNGRRAVAFTDRTDRTGLDLLVQEAESTAKQNYAPDAVGTVLRKPQRFADPTIYFASTVSAASPEFQGDIVRRAAERIQQAGLIGAGSIIAQAFSRAVLNTAGVNAHTQSTYGEYSATARTPSGKGSGWAWAGNEDFATLDSIATTERAIEVAKRSDQPVAIEPGRYTVILEPEALQQLILGPIVRGGTEYLSARAADAGETVFSKFRDKKPSGNKIGLQMTDRRVQLWCDPVDRHMPFSPLGFDGGIQSRTHWIENGVLKNLSYSAEYARQMDRAEVLNPAVGKLEVSGETQTLEEMIAATKRGIWVHRFSGVTIMSPLTLLLTGVTRDGTFLIENGKVTKAIKNLRFSESPFFVLNKIEAFGAPVRASGALACPRLKVRDFEFTSLSDAI